jgi:acyl transferase domain-containing protein/NAD(P)-dependent dehydrogenase (short-subunit alcohol dehydrogenase family)/acyl carrier protein
MADFWGNLVGNVDCLEEIPRSHWELEDYFDPNPDAPDKVYVRHGGFIPEMVFDPVEFGLPPHSLEVTDTAQLLALGVAKSTLADAGCPALSSFDHSRTGVVLGVAGTTMKLVQPLYQRLTYPLLEKVLEAGGIEPSQIAKLSEAFRQAYVGWDENAFPGILANVVAGRVSNRLNLGGLNYTVDAACASSLCAFQAAIGALESKQCDLMLAGGVDTDNSIAAYMSFAKTHTLSRVERVRPFDRAADGTLISEGIGMMALKRLDDALRDGNRIYAVVRGFGAASDGRSKSIYAPLVDGQVRAMRMAYERAGISPSTVSLVEAHAPGTRVGDATEFAALQSVFGEAGTRSQSVALGSVKSQIGHTKAAAGAASLLKAVLSLHHQVLPPTLNIEEPNPELGIEDSAFYLNVEARPWVRRGVHPRRAAVNALGFGGANFHVLLEEAPEGSPKPIFFGRSNSQDRKPLASKPAVNGHGHLEEFAGQGVAVFAGQGSQFLNMGRELALESRYFRDLLEAMDARLVSQGHEALSSVLYPPHAFDAEARARQERRLQETLYAQAGVGVLSMACYRLLQERGFVTTAAMGHSFGELTALWSAGVFSDAVFLDLICARGEALTAPPGHEEVGGLLSVQGSAIEVESWLSAHPEMALANMNAPNQTVIGGPMAALAGAEAALRAEGRRVVRLKVAAAFHTSQVAFGREAWKKALEEVEFGRMAHPVYSNTTGQRYPEDPESMRSLLRGHPFRPVHFLAEVENVHAAGHRSLVEIGPRNVLSQLIGTILKGKPHRCVPTQPENDGRPPLEACLQVLELQRFDDRVPEKAPAVSSAGVKLSGAAYRSPETERNFQEKLEALRQCAADRDVSPAAPGASSSGFWEEALECHHQAEMGALEVHGKYLTALSEQTRLATALLQKGIDPSVHRELERLGEVFTRLTTFHEEFLEGQRRESEALLEILRAAGTGTPMPASVSPARELPEFSPRPQSAGPEKKSGAVAPTITGETPMADEEIYEAILKIVCEKTGYPRDVIEPGMSLEADLGIDSIKQVEIFSAVRQRFPMAAGGEMDVRTIADIRTAVVSVQGAAIPTVQPVPPTDANGSAIETILAIICEKTGYPRDVMQPEMDLEADLGIDSIKQVEIFSAVRMRLALPEADWSLAEIRTVADIFRVTQDVPVPRKECTQVCENSVTLEKPIPITVPSLIPLPPLTDALDDWPVGSVLLLVSDGGPVALALASFLTARGVTTEIILDPTVPSDDGARGRRLAAWDKAALANALQEITAQVGRIRGVICLWEKPATSQIERAGLRQAVLLAGLLKSQVRLPERETASGLLFAVRLDGALGLSGAGTSLRGGIAGLAKTLKLEWPDVPVRWVDMGVSGATEAVEAGRLAREFFDRENAPVEVAYGLDGRLTVQWQACDGASEPLRLTATDTILVTGGGRGITASCLLGLVRRQPCRVIVVGRTRLEPAAPEFQPLLRDEPRLKAAISKSLKESNKPATPVSIEKVYRHLQSSMEIRETLKALAAVGVSARYVAADAGDQDGLRAALRPVLDEWGPVTGLIHGAGALADKHIEDLTEQDFETVFRPKVDGLAHVLALLDPARLKLCALFSSSASVFGNPGQAIYAMANEVLNQQAAQLRRQLPMARVLAFCWGPWDAGMVGPERKRRFSERGIRAIPVEDGVAVFLDFAMGTRKATGAQVVISDPILPEKAEKVGETIAHRRFSVADHPFVHDHVIGGKPVLPAAWALAWMAQCAEEAAGGLKFVRANNFRLLNGIVFDNSLAGTHELKLSGLRREGEQANCEAVITSLDANGRRRAHYSAELTLARDYPPAPLVIANLESSPTFVVGWESYRDGLIQYGPAFHGVEELIALSADRVVTRLVLPEPSLAVTGRHPNPALAPHAYDLSTHGILIWLDHFHNLACLPAETGCFRQFRPVPPGVSVYATLEVARFSPPMVEFSFSIHDDAGTVFHQGTGLRMVVTGVNARAVSS